MAIYDGSKGTAAGSILAGAKVLVSEDNGNFSSMRSIAILIVGWVATDIAMTGGRLTWLHVALIGIAIAGKVLQKAFERPAQGVVNARALEAMIGDAVGKLASTRGETGNMPLNGSKNDE